MVNNYFVYALLDPRKPCNLMVPGTGIMLNFEPFYIGKGSKYRTKGHFIDSFLSKNGYRANKINKIRKDGFEVIVRKLCTNLGENTAFDNEKYLIKYFGRENLGKGCLVNLTDGGEGATHQIISLETKALWSKNRKGKRMGSDNPAAKKCYQYDLEGNFIKRHSSVIEAAKELNLNYQTLYKCLKGDYKTCGNFKWSFQYNEKIGIDHKRKPYKNKNYSAINIIFLNENKVVQVSSLNECFKLVDILPTNVSRLLKTGKVYKKFNIKFQYVYSL